MAIKKFFNSDGVLVEVELPDRPVDIPGLKRSGSDDVLAFLNPTNVDPDTLQVDAAALPNLVPTDGAVPSQLIPPPPPGSGEGAGVGQPSGSVLRDPWNNNPNRSTDPVDTVQSGPVGSALSEQDRRAANVTAKRLAEAADANKPSVDEFEQLRNSWKNKEAIRDWLVENAPEGFEQPHASANRDELEDAAQGVFRKKQDELASLA